MITMQSLSHWGMFPCWEVPAGLPPMVEQTRSWMHVDFVGTPYQVVDYTLAEALTPNPKNVREIIANLPVDRQEAIAQRAAELITNEDDHG